MQKYKDNQLSGQFVMRRQFLLLELLRFVAAVAVVLYHTQHFFNLSGELKVVRGAVAAFPLSSLLWPFYVHGGAGVQVFWVISGFIMSWKYGSDISAGLVSGRSFFVQRFSRLYPLHLLSLLITALLVVVFADRAGFNWLGAMNTSSQFFAHVFFVSGWSANWTFSFNHPVWSVSVEIVAYAMFFLWAKHIGTSLKKALALLLVSLGLRLVVGSNPIALCLVYFSIGCVLHEVHASFYERFRRFIGGAALLVAATGMIMMHHLVGALYQLGVVVMSTGLVAACLYLESKRLASVERYISILGNLTYSSYLIHMPVQIALLLSLHAVTGSFAQSQSLWFMGLFICLSFLVSRYVYVLIEVPAQLWLRRKCNQ